MSTLVRLLCSIPAAAVFLILACGSDSPDRAAPRDSSSASPGATAQSSQIEPCRLATAEQVGRVLPNHDGGSVMFRGTSLVKGIDVYQCSYVNPATDLLTVIVNVAADKERFASIKKSASFHSDHKSVSVGDAAWAWGDANDLKVQVEKGRAILDLELMAKDAASRTDAMIELARAVAAKLP